MVLNGAVASGNRTLAGFHRAAAFYRDARKPPAGQRPPSNGSAKPPYTSCVSKTANSVNRNTSLIEQLNTLDIRFDQLDFDAILWMEYQQRAWQSEVFSHATFAV